MTMDEFRKMRGMIDRTEKPTQKQQSTEPDIFRLTKNDLLAYAEKKGVYTEDMYDMKVKELRTRINELVKDTSEPAIDDEPPEDEVGDENDNDEIEGNGEDVVDDEQEPEGNPVEE